MIGRQFQFLIHGDFNVNLLNRLFYQVWSFLKENIYIFPTSVPITYAKKQVQKVRTKAILIDYWVPINILDFLRNSLLNSIEVDTLLHWWVTIIPQHFQSRRDLYFWATMGNLSLPLSFSPLIWQVYLYQATSPVGNTKIYTEEWNVYLLTFI